MGLSRRAAAAELFLLWSGRGAGALVPSGMGLDVGLDFATPVGSRWRLPLGLELMVLCCCPVGFLLEEKLAGSHQTRPPTSTYVMWAAGKLKLWVQRACQTTTTAKVCPHRSIAVLAKGHFKCRYKRRRLTWWPFSKSPLKSMLR